MQGTFLDMEIGSGIRLPVFKKSREAAGWCIDLFSLAVGGGVFVEFDLRARRLYKYFCSERWR